MKYPSDRLLNPNNWYDPKTGEKYMYYDRDGKGIKNTLVWARKFEMPGRKIVKQNYLFKGHVLVSTIWMGLDHSFTQVGAPLIFETMVFYKWKSGSLANESDQLRWTTESQARLGHKEAVKEWSKPWRWVQFFAHQWWFDVSMKYWRAKRDLKDQLAKYKGLVHRRGHAQ